MRRLWTIIGVGDVLGSFNWYQSLLGLPQSSSVHDDFGQILDSDGTVLPRARALVARLEEEPHLNPSTGTREFSLRDLDGYYVTISALSAA
jgi:hypothetical protein